MFTLACKMCLLDDIMNGQMFKTCTEDLWAWKGMTLMLFAIVLPLITSIRILNNVEQEVT